MRRQVRQTRQRQRDEVRRGVGLAQPFKAAAMRPRAFSKSASLAAKDSLIDVAAPKAVPGTVATPWLSSSQSHNASGVSRTWLPDFIPSTPDTSGNHVLDTP